MKEETSHSDQHAPDPDASTADLVSDEHQAAFERGYTQGYEEAARLGSEEVADLHERLRRATAVISASAPTSPKALTTTRSGAFHFASPDREELEKVSAHLDQLATALETADRRIEFLTGELARAEEDIEVARQEGATVPAAASSSTHAPADESASSEQLASVRAALDSMRLAYGDARVQLEQARADHAEREAHWRAQEAAWMAERADLRTSLHQAQAELLRARAADVAATPRRNELSKLHARIAELEATLERAAINLKCKDLECTTLTRQMSDLREELKDPASVKILVGARFGSDWSIAEVLFAIQLVAVAIFAIVQAPLIADAWNDRMQG